MTRITDPLVPGSWCTITLQSLQPASQTAGTQYEKSRVLLDGICIGMTI